MSVIHRRLEEKRHQVKIVQAELALIRSLQSDMLEHAIRRWRGLPAAVLPGMICPPEEKPDSK